MAKQDNDEEKASSSTTTSPPDHLLKALDELSEGSKFLWIVFCLTLTLLMFNGMQSLSYVFTTEVCLLLLFKNKEEKKYENQFFNINKRYHHTGVKYQT